MDIKKYQGRDHQIYDDALDIRYQVFVEEQKVDSSIEIDEWEDQAIHYVLYEKNQAVSTARLIAEENQSYHLTRVATLKEYRGQGYGKALIEAIETDLKNKNAQKIWLSAQDTAIPFYEKLAYVCRGKGYLEANIPHHQMEKSLAGSISF